VESTIGVSWQSTLDFMLLSLRFFTLPFSRALNEFHGYQAVADMEAHEMHHTKETDVYVEERYGVAEASYPGKRTDGTKNTQTRVRVRPRHSCCC
jgi:hypothetical protein